LSIDSVDQPPNYKQSLLPSQTTLAGSILLVAYLCTDAFTSNWQAALYTAHQMSAAQMMTCVNACSTSLTLVALVQRGGVVTNVQFLHAHPSALPDAIVLSLCSAIGQIFIFHTIRHFGAVVFTLIMSVRQALAILLYTRPVLRHTTIAH
jgi:adenosine 3'-phospho 5'-phosphosulfate transporter B2